MIELLTLLTIIFFLMLLLIAAFSLYLDNKIANRMLEYIDVGDSYYRKIVDLSDNTEHLFNITITKVDREHKMIQFIFDDGSIGKECADIFFNEYKYKRKYRNL